MIRAFLGIYPKYDDTNFIAPSADVIGDVVLGPFSSVWFNTTIRGDVHRIRIGHSSNVQDNSVIHVTHETAPTTIGDFVTIGHGAIVHGCSIQDRVLVGMGSIILDHADIGSDSIIGAKSLVTARTKIPPRSMVLGSPAKVVRTLTDSEVESIMYFANNYVRYSAVYRGEETPEVNPFYDAER
ncbi:MAG: gamma carbonic anhydrase family protein [Rhodothermales bacterium]|nr:gamma carbonic anhydrase family protein [Rhodothermales bacterium]